MKKKNSKYEEVIIKTILANKIIEGNFFNNIEMLDWREKVNQMYEEEGFDGDSILAEFITNGIFEHHKDYEISNFIPTNISSEIDENIEKKFISKNEENKNMNKEEDCDETVTETSDESSDIIVTEEDMED
jgi:hypothetical protein